MDALDPRYGNKPVPDTLPASARFREEVHAPCLPGCEICARNRAAEPSVEARHIETYSLPQQVCAWLMRNVGDSFKLAEILKLMNEYTEAEKVTAKREGLEEAARLVEEKAKCLTLDAQTVGYIGLLEQMACEIRLSKEQQNGTR